MLPRDYEARRKFKFKKLSNLSANLRNMTGVLNVEYDLSNLESRNEIGICVEYDPDQLYSHWNHQPHFITDRIIRSCRITDMEPIPETIEDCGTHYRLQCKIDPYAWFPTYEKEMIY